MLAARAVFWPDSLTTAFTQKFKAVKLPFVIEEGIKNLACSCYVNSDESLQPTGFMNNQHI